MAEQHTGSKQPSEETSSAVSMLKFVMLCAAGLILTYAVWFGVILKQPASDDSSRWGQFGDYLGGILNPFIALFALALLAKGIRIQSETLRATRAELEETRILLRRQQFDSRFHSLIGLVAEHHRSEDVSIKLGTATAQLLAALRLSTLTQARERVAALISTHNRALNPFIVVYESILELLESAPLSDNDKESYVRSAMAFVTHEETLVISIFVLLDFTSPAMADLSRKYGMFRNLSAEHWECLDSFSNRFPELGSRIDP